MEEHNRNDGNGSNGHSPRRGSGPAMASVGEQIAALRAEPDNVELMARAAENEGAVAFVHFDPGTASSNMVEALIHHNDLTKIHRGMYVHILSTKDGRRYSGRVVEGPFYGPDALKRDSTPVQFIILNQGGGKVLSLPEYHGWMQVEILGEERHGGLYGATRRPHPASPILPYNTTLMEEMLHLRGTIRLGLLDNYEDVFVEINGNDKGVVPRNWLTVGTIGSGKSNTNQVFIEESTAVGYAQVVIDPEGEYIFMDQPSEAVGIEDDLRIYQREPCGIKNLTVYRPPNSESKRPDAVEFSVPFDSLPPELIVELVEMSPAQEFRFTFLYDQAIKLLRKRATILAYRQGRSAPSGDLLKENDDLDLARGYPGMTLTLLIDILDQELDYYNWKQTQPKKEPASKRGRPKKAQEQADVEADESGDDTEPEEEMKIYCHEYQLKPLIGDQHDVSSYGALRKKLREIHMYGIFDRKNAPPLNMEQLSEPGHLAVIDMSDTPGQQIVNIVIADLLARMYHYKMALSEEQNAQRKVFLTIEEAHGFVSRERQDKMQQTLDQLRRIARRGRKRWLALHFVTQSPQHLPAELFELANNKIIHQTTGAENLRVVKAAAGSVNEGIWDDMPALGKGRAVIVSSQYPHPLIVRIRPAASRRNYMV
jgi:hypothetical protein